MEEPDLPVQRCDLCHGQITDLGGMSLTDSREGFIHTADEIREAVSNGLEPHHRVLDVAAEEGVSREAFTRAWKDDLVASEESDWLLFNRCTSIEAKCFKAGLP